MIFGDGGFDFIEGGDDADTIFGGGGNDTIISGNGSDRVTGGQGRDVFNFTNTSGTDTITDFAPGWDTINAIVIIQNNNLDLDADGQFDDSRIVHASGTIVLLDQGQSTSAQADNRNGTTNGDTINGLGGNDVLNGIGGNDALLGDAGADSLIGETGDDWLSGGTANDTLDGGDGNDALYGGDGDDLLIGSLGGDFLVGGDGSDTISYAEVTNNLTINLAQKILTSGDGTFTFLNDFEALSLGVGNDFVIGWGGAYQQLTLGEGNDVYVDYSNPTAPSGAMNDTVSGGDGNDALYGLAGNDSLNGGAGIDVIIGGDGADTLIGGAGGDWMGGGAGADVFRYLAASDSNAAQGFDAVAQFETGLDRIDLAAIDANTGVAGDQAFTLGALAAGQAGRLQITTTAGYTLVEGDVNGDGVADIAFFVWSETGGLAAPATLVAGDFVL